MRNLLFVGDMHLREQPPSFRNQNSIEWLATMAKKIQTIGKIARRKNADIIQVGDLFDSSKNSNFFMAWVIKQLRDNIKGMSVVPGKP
jgi:DNA repair exonuclease SbcCD nuclease subunit